MRLSSGFLFIVTAVFSVNSCAVANLDAAIARAHQRLADYGNAKDFFPSSHFIQGDAVLTHEFVLTFEQASEAYKSSFLVFSSNITSKSGKYHVNDCRACGVKLSVFEFRENPEQSPWTLEMEDIAFTDTGSMGMLSKDSIRIIRTGRSRYSILLKDGGSMGGGGWSVARLFTRTGGSFIEVFRTHTNYNFPINMDHENERVSWEAGLNIDETQDKEHFDIVLEIDETQYTEPKTHGEANNIKYHTTCRHRYAFNGKKYEAADFEEPDVSFRESYPCSWKSKRKRLRELNPGMS